MELQTNTSTTWPRISSSSITLNFPPPASLTCSHNLEPLVTVVFINEHIVFLCFSRLLVGRRRKRKVVHLGSCLGQEKRPSGGRIVGHARRAVVAILERQSPISFRRDMVFGQRCEDSLFSVTTLLDMHRISSLKVEWGGKKEGWISMWSGAREVKQQ